jgi:hypothetical protein
MMDTAEFLAWDTPGDGRWQLIDGQPQPMAPASETHNIIKGELGALISQSPGSHGPAVHPGPERRDCAACAVR